MLVPAFPVNEKTSDTPTIKINDGKTVSAKVQPFQAECPRKEKMALLSPGQFTIIIRAIVIPRKASSEAWRFLYGAMPVSEAARDVTGLFNEEVLTKRSETSVSIQGHSREGLGRR
jgi:hypothetical protein